MDPTPSGRDEEEEKEEEDEEDDEEESDQASELVDDDRDFDFGEHTAQEELKGLMHREGTYVRCNWIDPDEEEKRMNRWQKDKKARVDLAESEKRALSELRAAASTCEHFQLRGPVYPNLVVHEKWQEEESPERPAGILRAISDSLANRLRVLRIDNFPGSGDPVFGTKHELRRSLRAPDLFGKLTAAFPAGSSCSLKKVTLQGGFHSAASVANFLRVAKPPLESFRCRGCLFHGRNFEMLVKALSACPGSLLEFETDAAIGGQDPFGFLADSLPQLQMLRATYIFGKTGNLAGLKRLVHLKKKQCKLPKENHRLIGRPAVDTQRGIVYWFITSERHDDNYSGEGLWWDELENTCECMEEWRVGKGVTKEHCLEFMEECGIELNHHLNDEDFVTDSSLANDVDSDQETDTIVVQLEVENSDNSTAVIRARTMDGRQFAQVPVDTGKMLTRTLVEDLAAAYPCSPLALRLVLHNGTCIDVLEKGTQPLAAVLA